MPLANQPLSTAEMLALYCFIEGLPSGAPPERLDGPIDYARCTYSADPTLEVNCGGCHDAETPSGELPLVGPNAYDTLLAAADIDPGFVRVKPGTPEESYLSLKLTNDDGIEGSPMPTSPLTGWRPLSSTDLEDIRQWIADGAPKD